MNKPEVIIDYQKPPKEKDVLSVSNEINEKHALREVMKNIEKDTKFTAKQQKDFEAWIEKYIELDLAEDYEGIELFIQDLHARANYEDYAKIQNPILNAFSFWTTPAQAILSGLGLISKSTSVLKATDDFLGIKYNNPGQDLVAKMETVFLEKITDRYKHFNHGADKMYNTLRAGELSGRIKNHYMK